MTRPQPSVTAPWVLRWLLVVSALLGIGVWQGPHCAADPATHHPAAASSPAAEPPVQVQTHVAAATMVQLRAPDSHAPASLDACHVLRLAVVTAMTAAVVHLPTTVRTSTVPPRPHHQPAQLVVPAVALAKIGVSRT